MKTHNHKKFKPTPIETTPEKPKRFVKETEEDNKGYNEIEDEYEKENSPPCSILMASSSTSKDGANTNETSDLTETLNSTEVLNLNSTGILNSNSAATFISSTNETAFTSITLTSEIVTNNISSEDIKNYLSIIIAQNNALKDQNKKLFDELKEERETNKKLFDELNKERETNKKLFDELNKERETNKKLFDELKEERETKEELKNEIKKLRDEIGQFRST